MKREIKFRAWDSYNNIMIYPHIGSIPRMNSSVILGRYENVMQYTGLKDKNDKEIYEGDVVVWYVNDIIRTAPVYYEERQASFWMGKDKDTEMSVINDWMRGDYEIIGNIYENPELLES